MPVYRFQFKNKEDKDVIISQNTDKYLIEETHLFDGNFLIFSDEKPIKLELSELKTRTTATEDALLAIMMNGGN